MKRRTFMTGSACAAATAAVSMLHGCTPANNTREKRPNIILIMTDDQGYGDVGCHGNDIIHTPAIDRLADEGMELTRFYVCPTCAPTRAGLLTGRYHHRTGVMGTMSGEALIAPDETTIAEILRENGYRTGIFGKWHLGDTYPRRPIDMGFEEEVVHMGGGLSQPSDPPGVGYHDPTHREKYDYTIYDPFPHWVNSNNYFDPILRRNGAFEQFEGYCTDIFFSEAIDFIERNRSEPFFAYIPTNAPHSPEIVSESHLAPYRDRGLDEKTARCYAMIENIDDNITELRIRLDELGLADNTILVFMGDNGPQYNRYTAGLRGRKAQFYEGGIRVPFFIRWPGRIEAGSARDDIAANIDLLPTLLSACGIEHPAAHTIDGRDILGLLTGETAEITGRTLFFQGNHGVPERYNQCAVVTERWKLINGAELYDLAADPGETADVSGNNPEVVLELRAAYEDWFDDVAATRGYDPQRIWLGSPEENPVTLTPQDWRGPRSRFVREDSLGWWEVDFRSPGMYEITIDFDSPGTPCEAHLSVDSMHEHADIPPDGVSHTFEAHELETGPARLEAWVSKNGEKTGLRYAHVRKR